MIDPPLSGADHFIIILLELNDVLGAFGVAGTYAAKIDVVLEKLLKPY
jgi:hypothetical protein